MNLSNWSQRNSSPSQNPLYGQPFVLVRGVCGIISEPPTPSFCRLMCEWEGCTESFPLYQNPSFCRLICEWEGCTESFPLSQNPLFLHHMQNHVHEETDKVLEGKTDRFVCKWRGCTKQDEGIKQELEFARHLLYHPFHQKLKVCLCGWTIYYLFWFYHKPTCKV